MSNDLLDELTEAVVKSEEVYRGLIDEDDTPNPTDVEWDSWVTSLFDADEELIDGRPVVAGLRRVAELVLGRVVVSGPIDVQTTNDPNGPGRATVTYQVVFEDGTTYADVADCWHGNTDDAFCGFTVAMASTRAEARALRKALKLKGASAEEMTSKNTAKLAQEAARESSNSGPTTGEYDEGKLITPKQNEFIDTLCIRAGINRKNLLSEVFGLKDDSNLAKSHASKIIDKLQDYIRNEEVIPLEVKEG